jgi:hypothetical protein
VRPAPDGEPRREILLALCAAGVVLFNFPMLILWDRDATVFGLPLLPVALFAIWAGLVGALAWASERAANRDGASGAGVHRDGVHRGGASRDRVTDPTRAPLRVD